MKCPTVSCLVGLTLTFALEKVNDELDTITSEVSITDCTIGNLEFQSVYLIIFDDLRDNYF